MSTKFITTKFFIPQSRKKIVNREYLINLLNDGIDRKLILVSAPAGYGKTSLIVSWLEKQQMPVTWVSIDSGDNDFYRFFGYMLEALHRVIPPVGNELLQLLDSGMPPSEDDFVELVLIELSTLSTDCILVIDDYHLINNPDIHESFFQIIERSPKELHFVICSRTDSLFSVSKLRSSGELLELTQRDLSLTIDESFIFMNKVMGMGLQSVDIAFLHERTEGWLVGMQMAAIYLKNVSDPTSFIHSLKGDNRFIGDYLVDEVLSGSPVTLQDFLLRTSVLNRMEASLCNYVLQIENSQELLEFVDKQRMFIVPLDDKRGWFRYHHLFGEMLYARLLHRSPELVKDLYHRAGNWKAAHGMKEEAIDYLLNANDFTRAAVLIEEISLNLVSHGRWNQVLNWYSRIPEIEFHKLHELWMTYFMTLLNAGLIVDMSAKLKELSTIDFTLLDLSEEDINRVRGELAAFQGVIHLHSKADPLLANKSLKLAFECFSSDASYRLAFARNNYAVSCLLLGEIEKAHPIFERNVLWGNQNKLSQSIVMGTSYLADAEMMAGNLHRADGLIQSVIRFAHEKGLEHGALFSKANLVMGSLFFEWNKLDDALLYITDGIRLAEKGGYLEQLLPAYAILARIRWLQGDHVGIHEILHRARVMAEKYENPPIAISFINAIEAVMAQQWGDPYIVDKWLASLKDKSSDNNGLFSQFERISLARVLAAKEEYTAMRDVLKPIWELALRQKRMKDIISSEVLMAKCLFMQGEPLPAMAILQKALFQAAPNHFVRTFLDEGSVIISMIKQMLNTRADRKPNTEECPTEYLYFLLDEVARETMKVSTVQPLARTVEGLESLTRQELHILHLVEAGFPNKQIALELNISLNTVKYHLKNIYAKLGVVNRTQAARIFKNRKK